MAPENDIIFKGKNEAGAYILEKDGEEIPIATQGLQPSEIAFLDSMAPGTSFSKPEVGSPIGAAQEPLLQQPPTPEEMAAKSSFADPLAILTETSTQLPISDMPLTTKAPVPPSPVEEFQKSGGMNMLSVAPQAGAAFYNAAEEEANLPAFPDAIPPSAPPVQKYSNINTKTGAINLYENGKMIESKLPYNPETKQPLTKAEYNKLLQEYPPATSEQMQIRPTTATATTDQYGASISPDKTDRTPPEQKIIQQGIQNPYSNELTQQIESLKNEAAIKAQIAEKEAFYNKQFADGVAQINKERIESMDRFNEAYDKAFKDYNELSEKLKGAEIKDYWEDKNIFSRILAALSIGLGGYSSSRTGGPNPALEIINAAIKQNYERQKANLALKKDEVNNQLNLINALKDRHLTESQQKDAYTGLMKEGLASKLQAVQDEFKNPLMKAQLGGLISTLKQNYKVAESNYTLQQAKIMSELAKAKGSSPLMNPNVVRYDGKLYYAPQKALPTALQNKVTAYNSFLKHAKEWIERRNSPRFSNLSNVTKKGEAAVIERTLAADMFDFENPRAATKSPGMIEDYVKYVPGIFDMDFNKGDLPALRKAWKNSLDASFKNLKVIEEDENVPTSSTDMESSDEHSDEDN